MTLAGPHEDVALPERAGVERHQLPRGDLLRNVVDHEARERTEDRVPSAAGAPPAAEPASAFPELT